MEKKQINTFLKIFPLVFILVGVLIGTVHYGISIEFLLILDTVICCIIAFAAGYKWEEMEKAFVKKIADTWLGVLILILIGAIVGTWIYSGAVPMLIYYGIKWINPSFIPFTAFVVTAFVAIFTGTSWGAAATSGVAFIGVAHATGVPLPLIAGAIISGAYVGDKNSPISDTTVLSAMGSGAQLIDHIKSMLIVTIPSVIISSIIFIALGFTASSNIDISTVKETKEILDSLDSMFNFNILLLLPAVVVFVGSFKGLSPIITMFLGSFLALILGAIFQDFGFLNSIKAFVSGFNVSMSNLPADQIPANLNNLLNRGGMVNMMPTVLFLITALTFGSMLQLIGTLQTILDLLLKVIKGVKSLMIVTWFTTLVVNSSVNSTQFTFLTLGPIFQDIYKKYKLHPSALSRTMEEGGTLTEPIVPWTVTGVYMASTLGVATLQYLPYSFFNLVSIVVMFIYILTFPKLKFAVPVLKEEKDNNN
ncbi:Na+/H+ antiporter NhaC [Brachyspira pilosicoli]|uniref:Na+/H+ antiporter NhaC n=1 Tax=Brachyspira pilosicoli TaxID=52584 RepID=A0A5C8EWH8_BRAPL|nr:Na+/H+ antiporter NhaC [Brachyspira pilosicoli]TXJ41222.1 Na+/H+ antiporter NhaC [Brachyspira pilosicoli]